ncbi:hypothetical protein AAWM_00496 [Aspergillus awamori]|uniref:DUF7924 domain-containing protein n=1 Tax=Aspergillus awamori TaxID=105351 RepID=A0A401KEE3_ASPAW|nr:hypothetical protein AAWM_00496 [Aspergillus awamori]GKZ62598.1 hypothetical protein AnigIFM49718_010018 [Aspergillus niger]
MQKKRKAPAPQHVEKQPKKPCLQPNPAVPDPGDVYQERVQALLQTFQGSSIHYWIQNNVWPKTLFNNVIGPVVIPPRATEEEEYDKGRYEYNFQLEANTDCEFYLGHKGSFWRRYTDEEMAIEDKQICEELLERECETPVDTAFDEENFRYINRQQYSGKNGNGTSRMIGQLMVPSAELEIFSGRLGSIKGLRQIHLAESIHEPWYGSTTLDEDPSLVRNACGDSAPWLRLPTPQPSYAVGFSNYAFSREQLRKLKPFVGEFWEASSFKGTDRMLFAFLVTEALGTDDLEYTIRLRSMHSMTRALRGVVELFRVAGRQDELHQRVLGFSVYYDFQKVEMFAHYVIIEDNKATYYCDRIGSFSFGFCQDEYKDRWRSYKFVIALYHDWVPIHHQRLCSAIDSLPDVDPKT